MGYTGITDDERREMLNAIGVSSIEELFEDVPESIRVKGLLNLPQALSEIEVHHTIREIESKNSCLRCFVGAGAYNHFVPSVVDQLALRSEYYTAYTPYQPEVSQGTLTAIFEFQTMICRLTGMDAANASLYDGATSLAEAALMSVRINNRERIVISDTVNPHYRSVLKTYAWANDISVVETEPSEASAGAASLKDLIDDTISAVVIQNPNFFGIIEDIEPIAAIAHNSGANVITVITEPLSLGLLKSPGELGADIVCGEAQAFGNYVGFGGPYLGILAVRREFLRKIPGRLVGRTVDLDGNESFVLTLQTREQHIRRERATSNICTNQGLCALRTVIYLSLVGNRLRDLAELNHRLASYFLRRLTDKGFEKVFEKPFFNEFVVRFNNAKEIHGKLKNNGYMLGIPLEDYYRYLKDCLLICCTEQNTLEDIDNVLSVLEGVV
jgi:glycine dehydrogenase subunit 1